MSSSEGYILNAIQTPGPLLPVYRSIRHGATTGDEIHADTGIESGLDAALDGLRLLRLIGREDSEYYTDDYKWNVGSEEWNFKLTTLHNLAQECQPGAWGKQAVVLLNYRYLLEKDIQYFENNEQSLYSNIDDWFGELGYQPQSREGTITHNDNKFANWTRLVHFLGLVHKARGREHTVYPDPRLILTSVELAIDDRGIDVDGRPGIEIEQYLRWLRNNLLFVETTSDGDIPEGLARVLFELVRDGEISAVEYGDAGAIGFGGVPPHEGIASEANTLTLT
ncbi:hypothetical protein SAMN06266787_10826 [Halorubrum ezzemoulense]|uniref:Uncharacterized protein n=1 Tax=Halorubrum ezzemoulense TaxID=337243 RepID=A0A238Y527_HALEZ|nr:hypothetical protein [Halorubrum ezzemoulense]SNR65439.1 hypothetical protein SAMN06266787_10826 [Halorubrum ezzemoulense]